MRAIEFSFGIGIGIASKCDWVGLVLSSWARWDGISNRSVNKEWSRRLGVDDIRIEWPYFRSSEGVTYCCSRVGCNKRLTENLCERMLCYKFPIVISMKLVAALIIRPLELRERKLGWLEDVSGMRRKGMPLSCKKLILVNLTWLLWPSRIRSTGRAGGIERIKCSMYIWNRSSRM